MQFQYKIISFEKPFDAYFVLLFFHLLNKKHLWIYSRSSTVLKTYR